MSEKKMTRGSAVRGPKRWILSAFYCVAVLMMFLAGFWAIMMLFGFAQAKEVDLVLLLKVLIKGGILSLITGVFTRWLQARKERSVNGEVSYSFKRDFVMIVGYDFQVKPLIKHVLGLDERTKVLLVTNSDVRKIRDSVMTELSKKEFRRVRLMRRDLSIDSSYATVRIRGARDVFLIGDGDDPGRDSVLLKAQALLAQQAAKESPLDGDPDRIKVYMHIDDPGIYTQLRSRQLAMDTVTGSGNGMGPMFDLEIFNYYESWLWKCWSEVGSGDGVDTYLPLRFRPGASRVELFVVGNGIAGKSIVDMALALMNYGEDGKHCRITVFGESNRSLFPSESARADLPETELACCPVAYGVKADFGLIEAAARRDDTSVTVVIAEPSQDQAVKAYMSIPFSLRTCGISVLMWTSEQSRNLLEKSIVQMDGDKTQLRYFGMSDALPWLGNGRDARGAAINYFYSVHDRLPKGTDAKIVAAAAEIWDEGKALKEWANVPRWKKWSSLCSSDTFKEKAASIVHDSLTSGELLLILKAEHNRWWAERLLADWRPGKRDNVRRLHPNLVPFEELDDATKDIDKICIAAMAVYGFFKRQETD